MWFFFKLLYQTIQIKKQRLAFDIKKKQESRAKKRDSLWDVFRLIHKFPLQPSTLA